MKKITDGILATVREVDGEKYYCLSEILEQLGLKAVSFNDEPKEPLTISAKIIWGFRSDSLNLLETVFVDEKSALKIVKAQSQRSN